MTVQCPTCRQQPGGAFPAGQPWRCLWCDVLLCGSAKPVGRSGTVPCYIAHTEAAHPEVYAQEAP